MWVVLYFISIVNLLNNLHVKPSQTLVHYNKFIIAFFDDATITHSTHVQMDLVELILKKISFLQHKFSDENGCHL